MFEGCLGWFLVAFLAATFLPAYSEVLFAGLLASGYDPFRLWAWATAGNTLGAAVNWLLGRYRLRFQERRWFPFKPGALGPAQRWFRRGTLRGSAMIDTGNATTLRVATYNIHQAAGRDGRRDPARVARAIASLDADLIALQEVDAEPGLRTESVQMTELAAAGPYLAIPGPTMTRSSHSYGNALLTRLEVERVKRFDLSLSGREPRGAIDACLRTAWGHRLRCVATHFGLSARERRRQLEMLLRILAQDRSETTVVLGDFNDWWPFSRIERALARAMGSAPRPRSFPSGFPLLALDRIWIRPRQLLVDLRVEDTTLTRQASDHLPLLARLRMPAIPGSSVGAGSPR